MINHHVAIARRLAKQLGSRYNATAFQLATATDPGYPFSADALNAASQIPTDWRAGSGIVSHAHGNLARASAEAACLPLGASAPPDPASAPSTLHENHLFGGIVTLTPDGPDSRGHVRVSLSGRGVDPRGSGDSVGALIN